MLYINYFIVIVIIFSLSFKTLILMQKVLLKHSVIKQYYITNFLYTICCAFIYISFPIGGLYLLRFFSPNKTLDLKLIYNNLCEVAIIQQFSYLDASLAIILSLLLTFIFILSIVIVYKHLINQMFNLYLFIKYNFHDRDKILNFIFHSKILTPYCGDADIITYFILKVSSYLNEQLFYYRNNLNWYSDIYVRRIENKDSAKKYKEYFNKLSWYHFINLINKIYFSKSYRKFVIPFSPLLVILYDCIFNNLVISHVYYYLLLYIPLMLIRKITMQFSQENTNIGKLIWDILYKKETCIYALPITHHKLFDIYIINGIKQVKIEPSSAGMDLDVSYFINKNACFVYNKEENLYYNGIDRSLEYNENKKLIYKYTDYDTQKEIQEEWILIAIKYHYHDEKSEIIVHID